ncbi:FHA domain-containing protein [Nocardioides lijunqiniae]|uniref:FHA domain-containing protein n=1 Tax=Nocardioides lijunqiniae TaxID=2760832 RepID=UPI001878E5BB|nr:FHA domain-containing protein [Nocardioides lijunqiniae]
MAVLLEADLEVTLDRPGEPPVHGRLRGSGSRLTLELDDPGVFAGTADAAAVRGVAETLAAQGIVLSVERDGERLVLLGAVSAPWWQRRLTGTRRIRLGSLRGAWTSARSRSRSTPSVLPGAGLTPPGTLWPLVPTLRRRPRRVTTTHDPARGGDPRLVLTRETALPGETRSVFRLVDGMTLGSDPACSVVLAGLEPLHARIRHDERDEWVVDAIAGMTRVHGAVVDSQILRTGARVDLGPHRLAYVREEYADHGRPFGGRIGGEAGRQLPQPPRTVVQRDATPQEERS